MPKKCLLRDVGENALRCSLLYLDVRERRGLFLAQKRSKAKYYTSPRGGWWKRKDFLRRHKGEWLEEEKKIIS
jgi:hypothetical protein